MPLGAWCWKMQMPRARLAVCTASSAPQCGRVVCCWQCARRASCAAIWYYPSVMPCFRIRGRLQIHPGPVTKSSRSDPILMGTKELVWALVKASGWTSFDHPFEPWPRAFQVMVAPSGCDLGCRSPLMVEYIKTDSGRIWLSMIGCLRLQGLKRYSADWRYV
jgi:hypothetical protein